MQSSNVIDAKPCISLDTLWLPCSDHSKMSLMGYNSKESYISDGSCVYKCTKCVVGKYSPVLSGSNGEYTNTDDIRTLQRIHADQLYQSVDPAHRCLLPRLGPRIVTVLNKYSTDLTQYFAHGVQLPRKVIAIMMFGNKCPLSVLATYIFEPSSSPIFTVVLQMLQSTVAFLNGINGEATNTDDLARKMNQGKKKNNQNKKLNRDINRLDRDIKKLSVSKKSKSKSNKHASKHGQHTHANNVIDNMYNAHDRSTVPIGLPTYPSNKTQKCVCRTQFVVTTGTGGNGCISFSPVTCNDAAIALYSSNSTTFTGGASVLAMNSAAAGTLSATVNLPYAASGLQAGSLEARVIGMSWEIECTSASLTTQGLLYQYVSPQHRDLTGLNPSNMSNYSECIIKSISKGTKISGHVTINSSTDINYTTNSRPFGLNNNTTPAAIIITGAQPSNPVTFVCHVAISVEYDGSTVQNIATANPIPHSGMMETLLSSVGVVAPAHASHPHATGKHLSTLAKLVYKDVRAAAATSGFSPALSEQQSKYANALGGIAKGIGTAALFA